MHGAIQLIELGAIILALGLLGAVANRFSVSAIPLYLIAGLAFGSGGVLPLGASEDFVAIGAEVGVILLLFTLGLEYTAGELVGTLRTLGALRVGRSGAQRRARGDRGIPARMGPGRGRGDGRRHLCDLVGDHRQGDG
ncbi:cation:proton antiporter [Actinomadura rudentiformis]|uniref:cation:proton antiporter n=1 Tax=Actinomadura rudentiformis TaxID=359158 RepID=UPI00298FDE8F|nr:cation:proton antiporter [Actinomadura rudentiformis]